MSVAYRDLLLGDRFSQVSIEDIFTKKPCNSQEQPTNISHGALFHYEKQRISSKIGRVGLIMHSGDE